MKKIMLCLAGVAVILASCSTLSQMASMLTCDYSLANVVNPRIAEVGITNTKDITGLDPLTALKVATGIAAGSLPFAVTVNVGVKNPNATAASLAGLDWALYMDDTNLLTGSTAQQVYVAPNGGTSTIPLTVQVDLAQLFSKGSKDDMLKFANGLLHMGESTSNVSLRIRPAVSFGGQVYKTGFITLSKKL